MKNKLYKSNDKMLCGVCSGIGKFFDIDPTIVRLLWAVITLCGGAGIVAYAVCALIIPEEPAGMDYNQYNDYNNYNNDNNYNDR